MDDSYFLYKILHPRFFQAQKKPLEFCDAISSCYAETFATFGVVASDFIRTTEPRHADAVGEIWRRLVNNGHIYRDVYQSWYSVQDEAFLTELQTEVRPDGVRGVLSWF